PTSVPARNGPPRRRTARPAVERLEPRLLLATAAGAGTSDDVVGPIAPAPPRFVPYDLGFAPAPRPGFTLPARLPQPPPGGPPSVAVAGAVSVGGAGGVSDPTNLDNADESVDDLKAALTLPIDGPQRWEGDVDPSNPDPLFGIPIPPGTHSVDIL